MLFRGKLYDASFYEFFTVVTSKILLLSGLLLSLSLWAQQSDPLIVQKNQWSWLKESLISLPDGPLKSVEELNNFVRHKEEDYQFYPDSVIVNSVYFNPKKYYYGYDNDHLPLTVEEQEYDLGQWVNSVLEQFLYNSEKYLVRVTWSVWDTLDAVWRNDAKTSYTYNEDGLVESVINEYWNENVWAYQDKYTFSHNLAGKVTSAIFQTWSDTGWVNVSKKVFIYNESDLVINVIDELWYADAWRENQQYLYEYDEVGLLISQTYQEMQEGSWVNVFKSFYDYNEAGQLITSVQRVWEDSLWVNFQNVEYLYDDLGFVESWTAQHWQDTIWINQEKTTFSYGDYGVVESELVELWDEIWQPAVLKQYNYDEYGNALVADHYVYSNGSWTQGQDGPLDLQYDYGSKKMTFFGYHVQAGYSSVMVGENIFKPLKASLLIFPNPVQNVSFLEIKLTKGALIKVRLYDLSGREIEQIINEYLGSGAHRFEIDRKALKNGIYFVVLSVGKQNITKKIILQ